jgi:hypothetical protein
MVAVAAQQPEDQVSMRRKLAKRALVAGLIGAGALLVGPGCAENESSLFVRSVLVVSPPECVVKADPGSTMLLGGFMDLGLTDTYRAALLVGNQLVRRGSRDQLRTETSRVTLRGAEVRVRNALGALLREFTVDGTGFVDPGTSDEPGYGVMYVPMIPPGTAGLRPNTTVVASVRVFGETLGGTEIESGDLSFPISLCNGCLVSFPPEADDPAQSGYQCIDQSSAGTASSGSSLSDEAYPCWLGQDVAVDCRICVGSHPDVCTSP